MPFPEHLRLGRDFYDRPTLQVARELLGKTLVHVQDGVEIGGMIVETEAYIGEDDQACHARAGRTDRTEVMYGEPGCAYVYLNYGLHWLLNVITERPGYPSAVLIRAIQPTVGIEHIRARRGQQPEAEWTNGPGKLSQALGINGVLNGADLTIPNATISVMDGDWISDSRVTTTPRVGLNKVAEPWKSIEWRFLIKNL
jgi:DNA-3-methyladenine glycosylase